MASGQCPYGACSFFFFFLNREIVDCRGSKRPFSPTGFLSVEDSVEQRGDRRSKQDHQHQTAPGRDVEGGGVALEETGRDIKTNKEACL